MSLQSKNEREFYDQGWNARCEGKQLNFTASLSWTDGWRDCQEHFKLTGRLIRFEDLESE